MNKPNDDFRPLLSLTTRHVTVMHNGKKKKKNVENLYDTITPEIKDLALEMGWKHFFSTTRIQLQLQLWRRQKQDA